ncbi:hypothetical protein BpOF4_09960 [Alkalihalophilus pseudofirmus OF4]|uniref:Uncharacterized protein n=1 Tax=Alkalihalophilus pseudofirmus (strain ATCC BAA-2126 / JCM 17055 / OF4) TaxID=398511 RepID=D3FTH4_ALKPO|nr:hypothetical protein [Alkalihalophilus pseudofirmus]ADC50047.1 hypothetical protein BpOF4_09960 [Alkalihalophilus pseudofirmus OF4]
MTLKHILFFCSFTWLLFFAAACSNQTMEEAKKEVASTDLTDEHIDGMKVGMFITDEAFLKQNRAVEPYPANDHYANQRNYDQYWNEDFIWSVDRQTMEVLQIRILEENDTSASSKAIKRGSPIEDIITRYGEHYYTYEDHEQSIFMIGYVDHQNNLDLSFIHDEENVTGFSLGYDFDRMKWETEE